MNKTAACVLTFVAGAAIGAVAAWKITKTKYEQIAHDEIEEVRNVYLKRNKPEEENIEKETDEAYAVKEEPAKPSAVDIREFKSTIQSAGYVNYSDTEQKGVAETPVDVGYIHVISPDDFGEMDGYPSVSLIYFEDDVLTDDNYDIVEDRDQLVGPDFAEHFGEYEDDSVFIRNDDVMVDFEILKDTRRYSDVKQRMANRNVEDY